MCQTHPRTGQFAILTDELAAGQETDSSSGGSTVSLASVNSKRSLSESSSPADHAGQQQDDGFRLPPDRGRGTMPSDQ